MTNAEERVVELPSAGVPADHGVSSLALLMQLAGTLFASVAVLLAVLEVARRDHVDGPMFVAFLASAVRSLVHRRAGTALLYARRGAPLGAIRQYIIVGLAHSIVVAMLLAVDLPTPRAIAYGAGFALWPLILAAILASGKLDAFAREIPASEDKGFEGAAILMAVFGACGALGLGAVFSMTVEDAWAEGGVYGLALVAALALLAIRAGIHAAAGLAGLRETTVDRAVERTHRYTRFALGTTAAVGGIVFLAALGDPVSMIVTGSLCTILAAWPLIIRRFVRDRQFAELLAGDRAALHRRAPDAGLTGLGWLLVGHAALTATAIAPLLAGAPPSPLGGVFDLHPLGDAPSPWWTIGTIVLEAWAGYELVRMSLHHRRVALCYGVVASAVALYIGWSLYSALGSRFVFSAALAGAVLQLVLPVATLLLVTRPIAPAARARYRSR